MFSYCNNNAIKYIDGDGKKLELAIAMYIKALEGESEYFDFSDDAVIGNLLHKNLCASDCFQAAIIDCIPNDSFDIPYVASPSYIVPYQFSTAADKELSYSVGKAQLQVEVICCEETTSSTNYTIHYTISDVYNFEKWKGNSGHSLKLRMINNFGGYYFFCLFWIRNHSPIRCYWVC